MPMLADIDDPPRSRLPGILLGLLLGLPVAGVCAWLILPPLIGAVVGSAADFDKRLRQEDQYMKTLCDEALVVARDEALCKCIWAVEFPSLDCHAPFLRWSLDRHRESCADPETRRGALSFCSCVDVIAGKVDEAEAAEPAGDAARQEALKLEGCFRLDDALFLPPLESLAPAS
jgi:hypothetical protein